MRCVKLESECIYCMAGNTSLHMRSSALAVAVRREKLHFFSILWTVNLGIMTRRRRSLLFLLLLAAVSPPSERHIQTRQCHLSPPTLIETHRQTSSEIQHLLLTPSFFINFVWISGLLLLSVIATLDVVLKTVYVGCSFAVHYCTTQESLPIKR